MHKALRRSFAFLLVAGLATPLVAQQASMGAAPMPKTGLGADLLADITQVETKIMGLARAMPASAYAWRPQAGVRSTSEVLMHVAADNWLLPAGVGFAAEASTGVKVDDYKTVQAFESRKLDRDATIAELARSFAHLKRSMEATPAEQMGDQVALFGQKFSKQQVWLMTTTHLHEHLGQLIAYARTNGVTPPWGQGG